MMDFDFLFSLWVQLLQNYLKDVNSPTKSDDTNTCSRRARARSHWNPTGIFQEAARGFSTQPQHTSYSHLPEARAGAAGCTAPQRIQPNLGKEKTERVNPPAPTWFVPNSWNVAFPMENDAIKITNNNNNNNNKITIGLFSKQTNTLLTYRNVLFFFWKTLSASLKKNSQRCPGRTWFCVADTVERPKMNSERNVTLWNGLERRQVSE